MKKTGILLLALLSAIHIDAQSSCKELEALTVREQGHFSRLTGNNAYTGASDQIDITYYRCEWEVNPVVRFLSGKITVVFKALEATTAISLDLMNGFTIDSVKQRNQILPVSYQSNILQISLPAEARAGQVDSVSIWYRGAPPNTGFGSFVQTQHAGTPVIWTLSEPYGSRDWWPCKNGLSDKADSIDIIISHPVAYRAASNGILFSETLNAAGTKRISWWKHRYPIASYLVCFAVTNYTVFSRTVQLGATSMPVITYCYPENEASFQANTAMVLDALQQFHTLFGPYPFLKEKYGHVQFSWGGGMEHQTASFIVSPGESLMVHELAHQWFGDQVTCGSWEDIWLNEGFATQLTNIYFEKKYPATIFTNRKNAIDNITSQPGGSVWVNDTTSVSRIFSGRLSYTKGSYLLYMLRWILGDDLFFTGLRNYLSDPKLSYGYARTTDLQRHLESVSGRNLSNFFAQWFKGEGYPSYHIEWTSMGSSYVKIKMNQSTSHPSVSFFHLPVALKFSNATQEKTVVLEHNSNGELFIRNIGFIPDTVRVDPEYRIISRNNTSRKIQETQSSTNQILVFPNPVQTQFFVWIRNFSGNLASVRLVNSLGQLVYSKSVALPNGTEFLEIPSWNLASGVYHVVVTTNNGITVTKRILK